MIQKWATKDWVVQFQNLGFSTINSWWWIVIHFRNFKIVNVRCSTVGNLDYTPKMTAKMVLSIVLTEHYIAEGFGFGRFFDILSLRRFRFYFSHCLEFLFSRFCFGSHCFGISLFCPFSSQSASWFLTCLRLLNYLS